MISKASILTIKSVFQKTIFLLPFIFLYLVSRCINLTSLPVFADEAIYIRWSQVIKAVETLRFIPLTDGKQPLFMWLTIPFFKIVSDPLVAGRAVSVLAGLGSLVILYLIAILRKFSRVGTIIILLVYLCSPFSFFFDRMALADNLLTMFGLGVLFLSLLQSRGPRLDISLILGGVLGLSWLTKSPAIFFIILSFLTIFLYQPKYKTIVYSGISTLLAFVIYNILRLGPQFHMIAVRNQDYVWTISEILRHPFDPLIPHIFDVFHLYTLLLPNLLLVFLVIIIYHFFLKPKKALLNKEVIVFFGWWLLPLLANAAMAKVFTARYILYTIPPLYLLFTTIIDKTIVKKSHILVIVLLLIIPCCLRLVSLSSDPYHFTLSSTESGYNQGWTSGWGINSSAKYLIERSKVANIIVGTEGFFGTLPDGLQIYTNNTPQLTVVGVGVNITKIPANLLDAKNHGDEVYLLINTDRLFMDPKTLNVIQQYPKPDGSKLLLIRI